MAHQISVAQLRNETIALTLGGSMRRPDDRMMLALALVSGLLVRPRRLITARTCVTYCVGLGSGGRAQEAGHQ